MLKEKLIKLSVSKTKVFSGCKKQFKFQYIDKLPKKDWEHHIYGKFVHKVLEDFHLHYINGDSGPHHEVMAKAFKTALNEYKGKVTPDQRTEAYAAIDAYLKKIAKDDSEQSNSSVIACEKSFELIVDDKILLNGFIDRIQIDRDGVMHVCDYKTTKNKKYLKNDWFQLLTYAFILWVEDPSITKVRGSYILIRHDFEYITAEFDVPQIEKVRDAFLKYAEQIESEQLFRANPTMLCNYCDYLNNCDEGRSLVQKDTFFGQTKW